MTSYVANELTQRGIQAVKAGNRMEARRLFEMILARDENDVLAWWWLARTIDDPKAQHQCQEKARIAASKSSEGSVLYRSLLQESGAPLLQPYKLAVNSKSVGDTCPICTEKLAIEQIVIICPKCGRAHHSECWEDMYCCGNFACGGAGLVAQSAPKVESAASEAIVRVEQADIPEQTSWKTREEQEAGFLGRLREQMAEAVAARALRQVLAEAVLVNALQRHQATQQRLRREAIVKRTVVSAFLAGLVLGIVLAIVTFQYSHSWAMAVFMVYLTATGIANAAVQAALSYRRMSIFQQLLPKAAAALIAFLSFEQWHNGFLAVLLGWGGGDFLFARLLRKTVVNK